jgi:hypothetical protein
MSFYFHTREDTDMNRRWPSLLTLVFAAAAVMAAEPATKIETIGACSGADVSEAMKGALQSQGYRVSGDSGQLCEIWLAKILQQSAGSKGAEYTSLISGSFAGVIVYPAKAGDYRGQGVPPGTYTMRYQTMPADGNHMGVSPTQDYFLLAPIASDQDPAAVIEYDALLALSRKASKTNHPTPLYLMPVTEGGNPVFKDTGDGHWAVESKTRAKAKGGTVEIDFPLAIVLIGKGEG